MSEIDLIPDSYRRTTRMKRWLKYFVVVYMLTLAGIGGAKELLSLGIEAEASELERLKLERERAEERTQRLQELRTERAALEKQKAILDELRTGVQTEDVFVAIDRALDADVWFLEWKFLRAGEFAAAKPEAVQSGYFIVVPAGKDSPQPRAWRVQTHMEIKAQARDHTALAEFVRRLDAEPIVQDVKVLNTQIRPYDSMVVVDFTLAVVVEGP